MDKRITIVGPEPDVEIKGPRTGRINIETLLLMAKYDDGFRRLLLEERERALDESGIRFSPAERVILMNTSRENLENGIREFSPAGVTCDSLPSWREAAAVMVLISTILFGADACLHPQNTGSNYQEQKDWTALSGWIDDDTFRLNSAGTFPKKITDLEERKKSARRAAILDAQFITIEKFKGYHIEGATGITAYDPYSLANIATLKQLAKEGKVIAERYDEEGNCEILFELKKTGLKKYMQSGGWMTTE